MSIKVHELIKHRPLRLKLVTGEAGLENELTTSRVQKTGLLLTGFLEELLYPDRIQILGAAEIGYLKSIGSKKLEETLRLSLKPNLPAIVMTRGLKPPLGLIKFAEKNSIPLLSSPITSSVLIERLIRFLEERLAPTTLLHGVFVDVLGIGILVMGKSGIGKSECALDLVSRGYRLVADDAVLVKKIYPSTLFAIASERIPYHIEVRGIGIVDIKNLFGITAIREKKQMDLAVELVSWDPKDEYERLGFEEKTCEILGVDMPHMKIPVSPGRSVATIIEVAARNQLLKIMGYHLGSEVLEKLTTPVKKLAVKKEKKPKKVRA